MNTHTRLLLVVLVVGALVRVAFWSDWSETPFAHRAVEDEEFYEVWAARILEGEPDPAVYHMSPLPAYVLAAERRVLGPGLGRVRLAGAAVGLIAVLLVYLATREAFGRREALLAAALAALYAPAIFYESSLLPLSATLALAAAITWLAVGAARRRREERRSWPWTLSAGAATGLLVLLRGNALLLVPALAIAFVLVGWRRARGASRWTAALVLLAGVALPIAPVTWHNVRGGDSVLLTWHAGQNLYIGNHPGATGLYMPLVPGHHAPDEEREDAHRLAERARGRSLSPSEISRYWTGEAIAFATDDPGAFLSLALRKLRFVLNGYELPDAHDFGYARDRSLVLRLLPGFALLFALAALGLVLARREGATPLIAMLGGTYVLSVVAAFVFGRYRLPLAAFMFPLAGAGAVRLVALVRERRPRRAAGAVVAAALALAIASLPTVPKAFGLASTYFNAGRIHELDHDYAEAYRAYSRAVGYNASHAKSLRGVVRTGLASGVAAGELLPIAERSLAVDPDDPSGWVLAGDVLSTMERRVEARRAFAYALRLAPGFAPALEGLSRLGSTPSDTEE